MILCRNEELEKSIDGFTDQFVGKTKCTVLEGFGNPFDDVSLGDEDFLHPRWNVVHPKETKTTIVEHFEDKIEGSNLSTASIRNRV